MRPRDENKQQLIQLKAIETIARVGFDGLSMHKLAKAAGVSSNTIYIYFKDREDLLITIYNEVDNAVTAATLDGFHPEMSLEDGVKTLWMNRYRYFIRHPEHMMLMEHFHNSEIVNRVNPKNRLLFSEVMTAFLENAKQNEQIAEMPFETYWAITFAPLFQLVKFAHRNRSHTTTAYTLREQEVMNACKLVLKAISK
jgi:AcrR family transcriptional regulator